MSKHVILFDYDGVIFRNKYAQSHVNHASIRYAQKFIKLPFKEVAEINNKNYMKYGHTVNMLKKMSFEEANMEDYNRFVFQDNIDYDDIRRQLTAFDHYNTKDIEECIYRINRSGSSCGIFTNSCSLWIDQINKVLDIQGIVPDSMNFTFDKIKHSKPNPESYEFIENQLNDPKKIIFVEDSPRNLEYCHKHDKWMPILVNGNRYVGSTVLAMYANSLQTHS